MGCRELKKRETAEWDRNLRMGVKRPEIGEEVGKDRGQLRNQAEG